jgi:hypothetical protein
MNQINRRTTRETPRGAKWGRRDLQLTQDGAGLVHGLPREHVQADVRPSCPNRHSGFEEGVRINTAHDQRDVGLQREVFPLFASVRLAPLLRSGSGAGRQPQASRKTPNESQPKTFLQPNRRVCTRERRSSSAVLIRMLAGAAQAPGARVKSEGVGSTWLSNRMVVLPPTNLEAISPAGA